MSFIRAWKWSKMLCPVYSLWISNRKPCMKLYESIICSIIFLNLVWNCMKVLFVVLFVVLYYKVLFVVLFKVLFVVLWKYYLKVLLVWK